MIQELLLREQKLLRRQGILLVAVTLLCFTGLLPLCFGCEGEQPVPVAEKTRLIEILTSKTWNVRSVHINGSETNEFDGLTLAFSGTTYQVAGGEPVWPADGTWSFPSSNANIILRDDGISITIIEAAPESIELSLLLEYHHLWSGQAQLDRGRACIHI